MGPEYPIIRPDPIRTNYIGSIPDSHRPTPRPHRPRPTPQPQPFLLPLPLTSSSPKVIPRLGSPRLVKSSLSPHLVKSSRRRTHTQPRLVIVTCPLVRLAAAPPARLAVARSPVEITFSQPASTGQASRSHVAFGRSRSPRRVASSLVTDPFLNFCTACDRFFSSLL
ncbi:hypothetical protein PIB30_063228 [Stylosanthes scabra]|uniref:Uncharacterized protein n=1 Tax=Stylosanthes scabra TaxID=79078 RepID=A0ABU6SMK3_9FABA|nr:hypothetical protein [Stylosanthes scabra]